ncbi:MAG TPA: ABC transporter permease subunit [Acidimicrobiales bacterium]|nr:ABC transporter permease subunit [Acidimicrobiales bacterium]
MTDWRRVRAILRKEFREYRRNGNVFIYATAILPLIFIIQPLIQVFTLSSAAASALHREHGLIYMLAIPVLVPAALAAYSVVGERTQGTLEPVLATPIRPEELLLGKALAAFIPSVVVAYVVFGLYVAVVELFARSAVASALIRGPELLAQLVFTPLLAAWSIWVGISLSTRTSDPRTAQQMSILANLPIVAVTTLVAFNVIPATFRVALAFGVALVILVRLGWRFASALFDRERLITNTK